MRTLLGAAPNGPDNLPELFQWPERYVHRLLTSPAAGHALEIMRSNAVVITGDHSGTGNGEQAVWHALRALQVELQKQDAPIVYAVADVDPGSRLALDAACSGLKKPKHVLGSIEEQFDPEVYTQLLDMLPEDLQSAEQKNDCYKRMWQWMLSEKELWIFVSLSLAHSGWEFQECWSGLLCLLFRTL